MSRLPLFAAAAALALGGAAAQAEEAVKDVSEVVVTGAPYVVSIQSTTTSVNVIKRDELDLSPSAGLGDVLAHLPGIRSSFFGPGASRPVIRGLAGPRVQVLTNGIGQIDASGISPDHQVASDPQEAERIEVLRGPSALAYGGSAIGGIVNVIDHRISPIFETGLHGRTLASGSSVDEGRQLSGEVGVGFGGGFTLNVDGVHRRSDDYEVPVAPGKVANSYSDLDAYGAGLSYVAAKGWGGLSIKRTDSDYGVAAEADVSIGLKQTRVDARGALDIDLGPFEKIKFAAGYADYTHTEFEAGEIGTVFLSKGEEARIELVQRARNGWQGAFGVQALHRNFDAIGEEALIPKTIIDEAGIFTLQRLDREAWGVEGGLRLDTRKLESARGARKFTNLSGSMGIFARPAEGVFLGLSLSRTSRAPSEEELFSRGAHPATGAFEVGDATLRREVSYSADATVHYEGNGWSVDLHGYYVDYDNFIDLVPTGAVDAESGFPMFAYLQTGAEFYGSEIEVGRTVWQAGDRSLRLEATADYVHGDTDAGPVVRLPPWSVTARGIYEGRGWTGKLELRRVGEQDRVAAFETPTDGYTQLNAYLVVRPLRDKPGLKLFVDGRNLTDEEAREHASFLKDIAPLPGRNVRLGVAYRF